MKRAFTLLELMVAVMLGAIILLVVAGSLNSTIKAWEAVQTRVGDNYNRRSVLDLIKRQTSSLFYRSDVDDINNSVNSSRLNRPTPNRAARNENNNNQNNPQPQPGNNVPRSAGFVLPDNTWFFRGTPQELNFLSTVSFLSDFPGQVAVRYYVVQGEPEEDQEFAELPMSRGFYEDDMMFDESMIPETLEGSLFLVMEEKNLFLSTILDDPISDEFSFEENPNPFAEVDAERQNMTGNLPFMNGMDPEDEEAAIADTNTMRLIGPLRAFNIRYRIPATRRANEADSGEDWAEYWDLDSEGMYPSAVEFVLFYEEPGVTDDIPTEELPGIRMVIPIYDANNLARMTGGRNGRGNF